MRTAAAVVLCFGLLACSAPAPTPAATPAPGPYGVLVFSKTAGFRHDSIPAGIAALRALGARSGFTVTATEDAAAFTADGLARFRAVVFLSTSGDVLDPAQQAALEAYVRGGGGWMGVHSAADTEYGWPFYGELVGARFARHPSVQAVTVRVRDGSHPATATLPRTWRITDEPYDFRAVPEAHILADLDESTYTGGGMGADHPIAWCRPIGAGRSFYVGLGHPAALYADPDFRSLLLGGIRYVSGT
ncbi:MAG TPA: ThuA domain-containing protein [Mycobacteriales bacterium]